MARRSWCIRFAGGLVVHVSSGVSALVVALVIGKRKGLGVKSMEPHDIRLMVLGAGLLWFGWFGFNAGSALTSGSLATSAFVVTQIAASAGALSWMVMSWIRQKKPSVIGIATGAIAGLAAITPAAGFVGPMAAVVIGFVIGMVSFFAIEFKNKMGFDDALDVWAVHGVGGIWGALALGLFANAAINGVDGLFFGNANQLLAQAFGIGVVCVYSVVVTFVILKVLDWTMGLRVNEKDEEAGLDISQHGERIP